MSSPAPSTDYGQMAKQGGLTTAFLTYHGHRVDQVTDALVEQCLRDHNDSLYFISELCLMQSGPQEVRSAVTSTRTRLVRALVEEMNVSAQPELVLQVWKHIQAWDAIPKEKRDLVSTKHIFRVFVILRKAKRQSSGWMSKLKEQFSDATKPIHKHAEGSKLVKRVWLEDKDDDRLRRHIESLVAAESEEEALHDFFNLYDRCRAKVEEEVESDSDSDEDSKKKKKKKKMVRKYTAGRHFGTHSSPDYLVWDVLVALAARKSERCAEVVRTLGKMYQPEYKMAWVFGVQALLTIWRWKEEFDAIPMETDEAKAAEEESEAKFEAKCLRSFQKQPEREVPPELALAMEAVTTTNKKRKAKDDDEEEEESEEKPKKHKKVKYEESE